MAKGKTTSGPGLDAAQLAAEELDKMDRDRENKRVASLVSKIELLEERIERLRGSRWSMPLRKKKSKSQKGSFTRIVIPDTHGCVVDVPSFHAMLEDMEALQPREIVWLGDHLECGGFLAQHHTLGYVAQTDYTFEQDVDAANDQLDKVQAAAPNATHHFLMGNHERRIETWCLTQALRSKQDANFFLRHFAAHVQLSLEKRGIRYYEQGKFYDGVPVPATIKLGHCYFTHGHTSAKHAAAKMLERYGCNVVFGHTHRSDEHSTKTVSEGTIKAWNPGCLCALQPLWRHTAPTEWSHGYGVQLVQEDGSFLHINVPIIDGQSYLIPFTQKVS